MPVTIQLTGLKYKNSQGQFQSADCLKGEDADISIIAPDYSELTFPVNAGKLCTHDLKLYRAKQKIPTSENWTESHWDERTIEEELAAKYTKPAGGIPASDLADGVIPDIIDDEAGAGDTDVTFSADKLTTDLLSLSNALNKKQEKPETTGQAGQVLGLALVDGQLVPVWITPASGGGDVTDVQIGGTSILDEQGVANIPYGTNAVRGVVVGNESNGLYFLNGIPYFVHSPEASYKGNSSQRAVTIQGKHYAAFYGLAKAAGADMENVSGATVGVYPDAQKIAIQKMLGIYEAPWELIREDEVTNATEADIEIAVDGNGQPFELTDIRLAFQTPSQSNQCSVGDYGRVYITYGGSNNDIVYLGAYTQSAGAGAKTGFFSIEQQGGMIQRMVAQTSGNNSNIQLLGRNNYDFSSSVHNAVWEQAVKTYTKITIKAVTGTAKYKIYGRRKWTA